MQRYSKLFIIILSKNIAYWLKSNLLECLKQLKENSQKFTIVHIIVVSCS